MEKTCSQKFHHTSSGVGPERGIWLSLPIAMLRVCFLMCRSFTKLMKWLVSIKRFLGPHKLFILTIHQGLMTSAPHPPPNSRKNSWDETQTG